MQMKIAIFFTILFFSLASYLLPSHRETFKAISSGEYRLEHTVTELCSGLNVISCKKKPKK